MNAEPPPRQPRLPFAARPLRKVISGGQTGVDRGALDAAIALGLTHGGWCPRGRRAEDGEVPAIYQLVECEAWEYDVRTQRNVLEADATLILCRGAVTGGTLLTRRLARKHGKPFLVVDLRTAPTCEELRSWLTKFQVGVLNVAGPRESTQPGIATQACEYLKRCLGTPP